MSDKINVSKADNEKVAPNNYVGPILGSYQIDPNICFGCTVCGLICPLNPGCCEPDPNNPPSYTINQELCFGCGLCAMECPYAVLDCIYPIYKNSDGTVSA